MLSKGYGPSLCACMLFSAGMLFWDRCDVSQSVSPLFAACWTQSVRPIQKAREKKTETNQQSNTQPPTKIMHIYFHDSIFFIWYCNDHNG